MTNNNKCTKVTWVGILITCWGDMSRTSRRRTWWRHQDGLRLIMLCGYFFSGLLTLWTDRHKVEHQRQTQSQNSVLHTCRGTAYFLPLPDLFCGTWDMTFNPFSQNKWSSTSWIIENPEKHKELWQARSVTDEETHDASCMNEIQFVPAEWPDVVGEAPPPAAVEEVSAVLSLLMFSVCSSARIDLHTNTSRSPDITEKKLSWSQIFTFYSKSPLELKPQLKIIILFVSETFLK